jgi:predicted nucleotidyltransferase
MTTKMELARRPIPASVLHPKARLVAYRGSIAQGLYEGGPDSDYDLTGFFSASASQYIGLCRDPELSFEAKDGPWDAIYYEVRHLLQLLVKGNPDAMQMLWTKPEFRAVESAASACLIAHRSLFITKQAFHSFTGFAKGQMERMVRIDWKKSSDERRAMFQTWGYDTKNAMHTVRTVRMATGIMKYGEMIVDRRDAGDVKQLLAIKHGDYSVDAVQGIILMEIDEAKRAYEQSNIPDAVDGDAADEVCRALVRMTVSL